MLLYWLMWLIVITILSWKNDKTVAQVITRYVLSFIAGYFLFWILYG